LESNIDPTRIKFHITEELLYTLIDRETGETLHDGVAEFEDTLTTWGKQRICELLGGKSEFAIGALMCSRVGASTHYPNIAGIDGIGDLTAATLEIISDTINGDPGGYPGTYSGVFAASAANQAFNSLACTVVLGAGQDLVFTVKLGCDDLLEDGNSIVVARLGNLENVYDVPMAYVAAAISGHGIDFIQSTNSVSNNTLTISTGSGSFTEPGNYTIFYPTETNVTTGGKRLHRFDQTTINLSDGQELFVDMQFIID